MHHERAAVYMIADACGAASRLLYTDKVNLRPYAAAASFAAPLALSSRCRVAHFAHELAVSCPAEVFWPIVVACFVDLASIAAILARSCRCLPLLWWNRPARFTPECPLQAPPEVAGQALQPMPRKGPLKQDFGRPPRWLNLQAPFD